MKHLLTLLLFISTTLFANDPICEGEVNYELIKAGKKTMEELSQTELIAVMAVMYGRKCNSSGSCSDAFSACKKECSIDVYVDFFKYDGEPNYEYKCTKACSSGESGCSYEEDPDEKCDEFEDDCISKCKYEFGTSRSDEALEKCVAACKKGSNNCF